jgi:hypothetical protein
MRRSAVVAILAAGLLLGSCSKTQDTAPESRLFGNPPVIQNVTLLQSSSTGQATCDITEMVKGFLCAGGVPLNTVTLPPMELIVNFSESQFNVQTTDPDTVAGQQNDILLVAASYQKSNQGGNITETSIVLLDDGSTNLFNFGQLTIDIPEECQPDPNFTCGDPSVSCAPATYTLTSNDTVANDNTWTRGFALVTGDQILTSPPNINVNTRATLAYDCLASGRGPLNGSVAITGGKRQYPAIADVAVGQPVKFKIEVVDRAGNLTTWPQQPSTTFARTNYSCGPDVCACCLLLSSQPGSDCRGREGLLGTPGSGYEDGVCKHL